MSTDEEVSKMLEDQGIEKQSRPTAGTSALSFTTITEAIKKFGQYVSVWRRPASPTIKKQARALCVFGSLSLSRVLQKKNTSKQMYSL